MEIRLFQIFLFCLFGYAVFGVPILPCGGAGCKEPSTRTKRRELGENIKGVVRGRAGNDAVPTAIQSITILATSGQTSAGQAAAGQTKPGQNSAGQTTAGQTSAGQTSAGQNSASQNSEGQNSAGQTSAGQNSAGQNSEGQASAGQNPAGQNSAGQNSAGQNSAGQNSAGQNSAGQNSAGQNSEGQASAGQNSAGQNSAGQTSAGQTSAAQPAQPPNTTQITQSINDWIQDVNTVNNFLDVALVLPLGSQLEAGAIKALSFAQNEPTNNKILGTLPGLDASGQAASAELNDVFGDVLVQLQNVVNNPRSLNTALNAVNRINSNRYVIFHCF